MTTPFRADNLGSILQPPELIEVRAAPQDGRIDAARLREIENRCILKALELQKSD